MKDVKFRFHSVGLIRSKGWAYFPLGIVRFNEVNNRSGWILLILFFTISITYNAL